MKTYPDSDAALLARQQTLARRALTDALRTDGRSDVCALAQLRFIESRALMGSVNKVILVGNLGRDAELRYTPGGAAVATINMATTEVWNDKAGQKQEKTEWHRVVLWGKTAESLTEYLTKGKQIYVEGRLQTRQWDDKDGNKRYTTEIRGDRVVLLGGGGGRGARRADVRGGDEHGGHAGRRSGIVGAAHRRRHSLLTVNLVIWSSGYLVIDWTGLKAQFRQINDQITR